MSRRTRAAAVAGLLSLGVVGGGVAVASTTASPAIQTFTPKSEHQITNIDVLRQQIRNYYGDPLGTGISSPDSSYAQEARKVARSGQRWLSSQTRGAHHSKHDSGTPAIVLDVDDTTLLTWNYEIASNWAYNPVTNAEYVTGQKFPAVPGMVAIVNWAANHGIAIFYLTGRPDTQEAATLGNLTDDNVGVDAGYPAPTTLPNGEDGLFTKPAVNDYPTYLQQACAADPGGKCTTVHYKAATRAHIESLGYDILANFGDQYSDLKGGYADKTFKLPNPNYFLP
jgi:predicted secreted acid phosphatase